MEMINGLITDSECTVNDVIRRVTSSAGTSSASSSLAEELAPPRQMAISSTLPSAATAVPSLVKKPSAALPASAASAEVRSFLLFRSDFVQFSSIPAYLHCSFLLLIAQFVIVLQITLRGFSFARLFLCSVIYFLCLFMGEIVMKFSLQAATVCGFYLTKNGHTIVRVFLLSW